MTEEYNIEERSKDVKPEDVSTDKAEKAGNGTIPATEEPSHSDEEVPSLEEAFKEQAREDKSCPIGNFHAAPDSGRRLPDSADATPPDWRHSALCSLHHYLYIKPLQLPEEDAGN